MENEDRSAVRLSGTRRTRSQATPDWAIEHALILVNEIAAVEADCRTALSTYQKWQIIVENCNALGVPRSLNQCRRKWDLLLDEYNKIKQWECQWGTDLYWCLKDDGTKECALPENFDKELYKAIDRVVRAQEDKSGTDRDSDLEALDDGLELIPELGSKKQRRSSIALRGRPDRKVHKGFAGEKPKKSDVEEKPKINCMVGKPQRSQAEEPAKSHRDEKHMIGIEDKEQMLSAKLRENTERIRAIVEESLSENADCKAVDSRNVEDFQIDFVRRQGDKLIASLGDILKTLSQFSQLGHECE